VRWLLCRSAAIAALLRPTEIPDFNGEEIVAENPDDAGFYSAQKSGSLRCAELIVPWLVSVFRPRRVVDVGCGVGTWASVFIREGVQDTFGIDGDYVDRNQLLIPAEHFITMNLSHVDACSIELREFDFAMSVEVAEHLPPTQAKTFVKFLTALAPVVLFGAAIPGQGGVNHINEQWQSYWKELFEVEKYVAHDIVRPRLWVKPVPWWYKQNSIIFIRDDHPLSHCVFESPKLFDVVHPDNFSRKMERLHDLIRRVNELERELNEIRGRGA
jgi:SAM-dependent methyltransferase